jgi:periplasmic divalent cation tolerance protein
MEFSLVITTVGSRKEAERIGKSLVQSRLAACVNVFPEVSSFFHWEGKLCRRKESLLLIKTKNGKIKEIINKIKLLHNYEVPEIIYLQIAGGERKYLGWLGKMVK